MKISKSQIQHMIQEELNERTFGEMGTALANTGLGKRVGRAKDKAKTWLKGSSKGRTTMPYVPLGSTEKRPKFLAHKQAVDGGLDWTVVDDLLDAGVAEADLSTYIDTMIGTGDDSGFDASGFSFADSSAQEPLTTNQFMDLGDNPTDAELDQTDMIANTHANLYEPTSTRTRGNFLPGDPSAIPEGLATKKVVRTQAPPKDDVKEGMVDGEGKPPPGPWHEKGKVYELEEGDTDEEYSVEGLVKESREQKSDLLMKRWGYNRSISK